MEPKNIDIIYENEDILAINKPAGVLVHREENAPNTASYNKKVEKEKVLTDWLLKHYPEIKNVGDNPQIRPGIVHRLDKDTSGVLIVAKNQKTFDYLKSLFQKKEIKKTYLALVYGKLLGKGVIKKPIGIKPGSIKRSTNAGHLKMIKDAITEYRVLKIFKRGEFSLLEVTPLTGKTHQIRVHLASIGHPIVGDNLYGRKKQEIPLKRQFLHAYSLEFNLQNNGRIKIEADLPYELQEILESLYLASEEKMETITYDE
jgi:23S rRNA pseudouridine1911/1915/1917 synthase